MLIYIQKIIILKNRLNYLWQPNGNQVATQYSVVKGSIVQDSLVEGSVDDDHVLATEEDQRR